MVAAFGGLVERFILRKLAGNVLGQVLVTLGIAFMIADFCHRLGRRPDPGADAAVPATAALRRARVSRPTGWSVIGIAIAVAIGLYLLMERTRLGAMIRAGVDDMQMARAVGIPVSKLFTTVFCLGALLAGAGGIIGGPMLSAYPGLDSDMLPLALIVVILGGVRQPDRRVRRQLHHRLRLRSASRCCPTSPT